VTGDRAATANTIVIAAMKGSHSGIRFRRRPNVLLLGLVMLSSRHPARDGFTYELKIYLRN
jgi:hypothetical protein